MRAAILLAVAVAACGSAGSGGSGGRGGRRRGGGQTEARELHVAKNGDDGNDGSEARPWATLGEAASEVRPGDTVIVHPGTYEGFELTRGGEEGRPITFQAMKGARIEGGNVHTEDGINITGAPWVVIEGFEIYNAGRAGIRVVESEHVTLRKNDCHDNFRWGIFTGFAEDVTIEENDTSGSQEEHGIYVSNSADNPIIRNNRSYENVAGGIQLNADIEMGGDGIITGAVIEGNKIWANGKIGGAAINLDGVDGGLVQNNVLYNNHGSGIALFKGNGKIGSRNCRILHNTVVMAKNGRWAVVMNGGASGNVFYGNVFWHLGPKGSFSLVPDSMPKASDHNVLTDKFTLDDEGTRINLAAWRKRGFDSRSLIATPDEIFEGKIDFHLKDGSPAIDAGDPEQAPPVDLEGHLRDDGKPDIGAYERK